jgi:acetoin utilization protein AcuB
MFVRDIMTRNPLSVRSDATLTELLGLMTEKTFEAIPVRDNGQVTGIVTDWDIVTNTPTGVSDYFDTTKVRDVMTANVVTVTSDEIVEMAAFHMYFHDLDALPVVDSKNELIGIITQNDVFRAMVTLTGLRAKGTRITIDVPDEAGVLAEIAGIVRDAGINISSLSTYGNPGSGRASIILRVRTDKVQELVKALNGERFRVVHVSDVWK